MIIIAAVDDGYGLLFNNRRVSRDRELIKRILSLTDGETLWMNEYSRTLFPDECDISVDEEFLKKASGKEYCFVENEKVFPYEDKIEKMILYKWNRDYPSDFELDVIPCGEWGLVSSEDFAGYSHEKITEEIWER